MSISKTIPQQGEGIYEDMKYLYQNSSSYSKQNSFTYLRFSVLALWLSSWCTISSMRTYSFADSENRVFLCTLSRAKGFEPCFQNWYCRELGEMLCNLQKFYILLVGLFSVLLSLSLYHLPLSKFLFYFSMNNQIQLLQIL